MSRRMTKRKPATPGEILTEEFMKLMALTRARWPMPWRKHVNEPCNDRRNVTAASALILARVFGNSPECWPYVQQRTICGGDEFGARPQADRTRTTADAGGLTRDET
jgi:antitoxin HigA-1